MPDLLDRTARQVRLPGGTVHKLTRNDYNRNAGHIYKTRCGRTLAASIGAVLTTHEVACADCKVPATEPAEEALGRRD